MCEERRNKRSETFLVLALGIIIGVLGSFFANFYTSNQKNIEYKVNSSGEIIREIDTIISKAYLYDVDKEKMEVSAIKGYVSGLGDKYASYFTPSEYKDLIQSYNGKYVGVGITFTYDENKKQYKVESLLPSGSAYKSGIKVGSYLNKILDTKVDFNNLNELILKIRKIPQGEKVKFEMFEDGKIKTYNLEVRELTKNVVSSNILNGHLYLKITEFDKKTHPQLINEIKKYSENDYKGYIIDLRNNPGGDLNAVIDVSSEFIKGDVITYMLDKKKNKTVYKSKNTHNYTSKPMVIITNKNSASASELFTGAAKAYKRATIIGEKTFGKGVVQQIFPLSNGGAFKETISKYYTPDDKNIDGVGITPDIIVEPSSLNDELLNQNEIQEAIKYLNK